jgi:transposase
MPTRERARFDEAFRQHAVALVNGGRPVSEVARELGVSPFSLYEWRRKIRRKIDLGAPIPTTVEALEDEVARLREALHRSQMREEILKKSLGIFVEAPGKPSPSSRR